MKKTAMTRHIAALAAAIVMFAAPVLGAESIIVQSTTSTQNSGLLDYLLPKFEKKTGIRVKVVAVGTGQALKNARNGDGDVVLVHARDAEMKFLKAGWGVDRRDVMYNDFVIVCPAADPAGIRGMHDAAKALKKIAARHVLFVSRADDSGTNKKEMKLWKAAGIDPRKASGSWYRETGSGMGATLNAAAGMGACTLTDRGTWISFKNKHDLAVMVQGDKALFNQYGVMLVNPAKHPTVKEKAGRAFMNWLTGPEGQKAIASYRLGGQQLFFPNAAPTN
jgi:tungstate transport system substrate-binding protein